MPAHLRHPRSPWLWPACWLATLALLVGLCLVPRRWWDRILPRGDLRPPTVSSLATVPLRGVELEILPAPPALATVPDREAPPEPLPAWRDASWWDRAWEVRITTDLATRSVPADADTVPWDLLAAWELPLDDVAALALTDSVLALRIWEMALEESLDLSHLRAYFHAIGRARMYADLKSREAAMYDEFQFEEVMVPDANHER